MKLSRLNTIHYVLPAALIVIILICCASCTRQPAYSPAPQQGTDIVVDIKDLVPETPRFYTYQFQGKNVSFFVLKIGGKISSFFDACASCYSHKQGYRYDDGAVTCRFCNMQFSVHKLEKGLGSCYPIKIEGRTEGGKYIIPVAVLEKETGKF